MLIAPLELGQPSFLESLNGFFRVRQFQNYVRGIIGAVLDPRRQRFVLLENCRMRRDQDRVVWIAKALGCLLSLPFYQLNNLCLIFLRKLCLKLSFRKLFENYLILWGNRLHIPIFHISADLLLLLAVHVKLAADKLLLDMLTLSIILLDKIIFFSVFVDRGHTTHLQSVVHCILQRYQSWYLTRFLYILNLGSYCLRLRRNSICLSELDFHLFITKITVD
jgi:hypothetical protein